MALLRCRQCGALVKADWTTCKRCLVDLRTKPPDPGGGDVSGMGVAAWIATVFGNLVVLFLCILPAIAFVIAVLVLLFAR